MKKIKSKKIKPNGRANKVKQTWEQALEANIKDAFDKILIGPGGVNLESFLEQAKKIAPQVLSEKKDYIEKWQIISELHRLIYLNFNTFESLPKVELSFAKHFTSKQIVAYANMFVKFIASLPRKYEIFFSLPQLFESGCENPILTDTVKLIEIKNNKSQGLTLGQLLDPNSIKSKVSNKEISSGLYFNLKLSGYGFGAFDNPLVVEGFFCLKQTIFLLYIEGLIEFDSLHSSSELKHNATAYLADVSNNQTQYDEIHIPDSLKSFLNRVKISKSRKEKIDKQTLEFNSFDKTKTYTLLGGPITPDPYLSFNDKYKKVIDANHDNHNAVGLKNALNWGFDSIMNEHDPLMAYIQLSIALEAVLGVDSEKNGKTNQLADRCAMLIGKSRLKRNEIRKDFVKFYNVRSDIVHGEKVKSDSVVEGCFHWGMWALKSILRRELSIFGVDIS